MDDLSEYESGFSKPIKVPVNQTKSVLFYDLKNKWHEMFAEVYSKNPG